MKQQYVCTVDRMAGEENIKLAVQHLQKAVFEKTRQMKDMLKDFDRQRKDLEHDITKLSKDVSINTAIAADGGQSDARRATAASAAASLKGEIDERRTQISRLHDQVKDQVKGIELEIVAINEDISDVQQLR